MRQKDQVKEKWCMGLWREAPWCMQSEELKEEVITNPGRPFYPKGHRETVPDRLQKIPAA